MASVILHIAEGPAWERAVAEGRYRGDTLDTEGFIHCSEPHQVIGVANAVFRGRRGLVLLAIDTARLASELRREALEPGAEEFPHIYGTLNVDAVVEVYTFEPEEDGTFRLPLLELPEDWYEDDESWYEGVRQLLERTYLATDDPYRQSGFGGDAAR